MKTKPKDKLEIPAPTNTQWPPPTITSWTKGDAVDADQLARELNFWLHQCLEA